MEQKTSTQNNKIIEIVKSLELDVRIATLLYQRGLTSVKSVEAFLHPHKDMLEAPCITNIDKAVQRIQDSVTNGEKIVIFGDYDCDGICSVAMLKMYLEKLGASPEYYIPTREEGYGLSIESLEKVVERHLPDLIITVDCGITALEEVMYCYEVLGVDIIVTDHHEPADELPDCIVVNPKIDKDSTFRELCGAGVVFKLIEAHGGREAALEYVDLACIATIADVVPLLGENRIIASLGLKKLNTFDRQGLKMLADSVGVDRISAADIGYKIAPRINAPGRMGCKNDIIPLFCSNEYFELESIVRDINQKNEKRQNETNLVYAKALEKIKELKLEETSVIIIEDADWDYGLLGLVAARLATDFSRPVIVLNSKTEYCKGSARSIKGINIYECLKNSEQYLEHFGGHEGAAGLCVNIAKLKEFCEHLQGYVRDNYANVLEEQTINYDINIHSKESIDVDFYRQISLLEPTGEGNKPPLFLLDSKLVSFSQIGTTEHIKIRLNRDTEGVLFNNLQVFEGYKAGVDYQFVTTINLKKYKNINYINLAINDTLVRSVESIKDTLHSFVLYLKTMLYEKSATPLNFISYEQAFVEAGEKGTVVIAFSASSGKDFASKQKDYLVSVGQTLKNPVNTLLLFPNQMDYSYYRKAIILDTPLSTGYMENLQKTAPETEFLLVRQYGFLEIFGSIDISAEAIINTHKILYNYLNIHPNETSLSKIFLDMAKYGYTQDEYSFAVHFVALFDYGIIENTQNRYSVKKVEFDKEKSRVINTIKRLRN